MYLWRASTRGNMLDEANTFRVKKRIELLLEDIHDHCGDFTIRLRSALEYRKVNGIEANVDTRTTKTCIQDHRLFHH